MITKKIISATVAALGSTVTAPFYGIRGALRKLQIVCPAIDATDTFAWELHDAASEIMHSATGLTQNDTYTYPVAGDAAALQTWFTNADFYSTDPTAQSGAVKLTTSTNQTADRVFTIRLWFDEKGAYVC